MLHVLRVLTFYIIATCICLVNCCTIRSQFRISHLQPHLFQTAIRWWLGISHTASPKGNSLVCPLCPDKALDTLGHHCTTCKCGGDVTNRHNMLRNALFSTFRRASLSAHLEVGCGWGLDKSNTRPADILVSNRDGSASAAFDIPAKFIISCGSGHVI